MIHSPSENTFKSICDRIYLQAYHDEIDDEALKLIPEMASFIMFSPFCSVFRPSFPIKGLGNLIDSMIRGERDMENYDYWRAEADKRLMLSDEDLAKKVVNYCIYPETYKTFPAAHKKRVMRGLQLTFANSKTIRQKALQTVESMRDRVLVSLAEVVEMVDWENSDYGFDYWNGLYNDNYKFKQVGDRMTCQIEFERAQINKIKEELNRLKK